MNKKSVRLRPDRTGDDERRMGTFFYKVAALVIGLLALIALLAWAVVRLML